MVMGYKNAPQIMQRVMNSIFAGIRGKGVEVYMDDIVVHSKEKGDHDILLIEVIRRLKKNNMKLNPSKIQFAEYEI